MNECFVIFRKDGKIINISFDAKQAHMIAKNEALYDEIYWCVPHLCEYNKKTDKFLDPILTNS